MASARREKSDAPAPAEPPIKARPAPSAPAASAPATTRVRFVGPVHLPDADGVYHASGEHEIPNRNLERFAPWIKPLGDAVDPDPSDD